MNGPVDPTAQTFRYGQGLVTCRLAPSDDGPRLVIDPVPTANVKARHAHPPLPKHLRKLLRGRGL